MGVSGIVVMIPVSTCPLLADRKKIDFCMFGFIPTTLPNRLITSKEKRLGDSSGIFCADGPAAWEGVRLPGLVSLMRPSAGPAPRPRRGRQTREPPGRRDVSWGV